MTLQKLRQDSIDIFDACLKGVDPVWCVKSQLRLMDASLILADRVVIDLAPFDRILVVGMGKASAKMAAGVEEILGDRISGGLVIVKRGHSYPLKRVRVAEADHPVPDTAGIQAARELLKMVEDSGERDLIVSLISGGGSALAPAPAMGLDLKDKQDITRALLKAGADIHEINTVRKHLSGIKGGGLAKAAFPATVVNLMISDVVGDDPAAIASGPFAPDRTTFREAMGVLEKYHIGENVSGNCVKHIKKGLNKEARETAKPGDPVFERVYNRVACSNIQALDGGRSKARELGYNDIILSSRITGDTREAANFHGAIAREILSTGNPVARPACLLSGGETTVLVRGSGEGGRNQEFACAIINALRDIPQCLVLSAGSDGTDGPTDAAGAFADSSSYERAMELGLDPEVYLEDNDSYGLFSRMNDLFITGPTWTNVMDIRIMLLA